jgi:hypothetical protein
MKWFRTVMFSSELSAFAPLREELPNPGFFDFRDIRARGRYDKHVGFSFWIAMQSTQRNSNVSELGVLCAPSTRLRKCLARLSPRLCGPWAVGTFAQAAKTFGYGNTKVTKGSPRAQHAAPLRPGVRGIEGKFIASRSSIVTR